MHHDVPPLTAPSVIRDLPTIGALVRAARKAQKLRIDDAAGFNHVSVDLMSRLENGSGGVRLDKLLQVLDGLGLAMLITSKEQAQQIERSAEARSHG